MTGGELPYFRGSQFGNGWLKTLGRIAFPILKRIVGVAADTAQDVIMHDKKLLPSLTSNALNAVSSYTTDQLNKTNKRGSGINKRAKKNLAMNIKQ
jgi:hypothetical protein